MEKKDVFARLASLAATEEQVAVATVVRTHGSTPREVGAKMVVTADGTIFGTVGGGCGEADVWQVARHAIRDGRPARVLVDLMDDPDQGEAICGGTMEVFVELYNREDMAAAQDVVGWLDQGEGVCVATVVEAAPEAPCQAGHRVIIARDALHRSSLGDRSLDEALRAGVLACQQQGRSTMGMLSLTEGASMRLPAPRQMPASEPALAIFMEILERPPFLVIAGAGHCAIPLARMGKMLGFVVVVLDDRPQCATHERFPDATRLLVGDLTEQAQSLTLDRQTAMVLVTRGHRLDETILRSVVRSPLAYLGMIGSRRRVAAVLKHLADDGYDPADLARVHTPIGLDIGADTPEEIAVSILAEIVMVRKGGTGRPLSTGS